MRIAPRLHVGPEPSEGLGERGIAGHRLLRFVNQTSDTSEKEENVNASVRRVSTLALVAAFIITACGNPTFPTGDMAQKLKEGCRDEGTCQALVRDARTRFNSCSAEDQRLRGMHGDPNAGGSQLWWGITHPSGDSSKGVDCAEAKKQWHESVARYVDRRIALCENVHAPKGDAAWDECPSARKAILAIVEENQGAKYAYQGDTERYLDLHVCNAACHEGGQAECCSIIQQGVDQAVAAKQAADCPRMCLMTAPVPSWCPHGCMTVDSSDPQQCIEACRRQNLCMQSCK